MTNTQKFSYEQYTDFKFEIFYKYSQRFENIPLLATRWIIQAVKKMGVVSILFSHLFTAFSTLLSSGFDTSSDLINSLDFFQYNASSKAIESLPRSWPFDEIDNVSNKEHTTWGIVGISLMFLPGIIGVQSIVWPYISREKYTKALLLCLGALAYPVTLIVMAFASIFGLMWGSDKLINWTMYLAAAEAFFESFQSRLIPDKTDEDKEDCMSSSGFKCDFNSDFKTCKLVAFEGYSYNIYLVIENKDIE